jgi:hypothetical protein
LISGVTRAAHGPPSHLYDEGAACSRFGVTIIGLLRATRVARWRPHSAARPRYVQISVSHSLRRAVASDEQL